MTQQPFVPEDFVVPLELVGPRFRLIPLGPEHNAADYAAWTQSMAHIRATPGFAEHPWPHEMTAERNLSDLQEHAKDFAARTGFTYTVLPPAGDPEDVIGCVYVYPTETETGGAASVRSWVRVDQAALDLVLSAAVRDCLARDWPFASVEYAARA